MFTGIIECLGEIKSITKSGTNINFTIKSSLANELKIDQSISYNGVCLTVVNVTENYFSVTAINETLLKTNFKSLDVGDLVNLERAMKINNRLDGHIIQGHIDQTGVCTSVKNQDGSWIFNFKFDPLQNNITIEKGSIAINGVSLTVINSKKNSFSVAIIPYTYENTNFHKIIKGEIVNLEFDILGKYISKMYSVYKKTSFKK
ncbi:MAG: riboflavin synthase [Flavobacteriaceae bacterium]|nr:riboflavin synthase [Flavobacteriaceae bacterium]